MIPLIFAYMCAEYEKNGTFQLSNRKPQHDMVKVLQSGLYLNHMDMELVDSIKELYRDSEWLDIVIYKQELMDLFGDSAKEVNSRDEPFSLNVPIDRWTSTRMPILFSGTRFLITIFDELSVIHFFLVIIILFSVFMVYAVKKRESVYLLIGILGGILSILISTIIGTFNEFGRCLVEILSFYYVGVTFLATILINWSVEKIELWSVGS